MNLTICRKYVLFNNHSLCSSQVVLIALHRCFVIAFELNIDYMPSLA